MKKIIYSLLLILFIVPVSFAQKSDKKAVKILDNTVELIINNSIKTNFGMVVMSPDSKDANTMKGSFILKGNKFVLEMEDMSVYFDGKTQWAYVPDFNEVSITNPTEGELAETNPMALLNAYKAKSIIQFSNKPNKPNVYALVLTPKSAKDAVKKIFVQVNKNNFYPLSIQLVDKKGMISSLSLINFKVGISTSNSTFVFDKSKYANIEVNDLR